MKKGQVLINKITGEKWVVYSVNEAGYFVNLRNLARFMSADTFIPKEALSQRFIVVDEVLEELIPSSVLPATLTGLMIGCLLYFITSL